MLVFYWPYKKRSCVLRPVELVPRVETTARQRSFAVNGPTT